MVRPLCGFSLEKGTRFIAVLDLLLYLLSFLAIEIVDYYSDVSENHSIQIGIKDNSTNLRKTAIDDEPEFRVFGRFVSMYVYMFLAVTILIMAVAEFLLEIWMFFVLTRASKNQDASACRLWLWLRATQCVLYLTLDLLKYATVGWEWRDWIIPPYVFYTLWEFIVVNEFRKEVKATARIVKLRDKICYEF